MLRQTKGNEARITAYNQIFRNFEFSNGDSALHYMKMGLKEFEEKKYLPGQAALHTLIGNTYSIQGALPLAKVHITSAMELFTKMKDNERLAIAHNSLGIIEGKSGNFQEALENFYAALKIFEKAGNKEGIAKTYLKLGVAYELTGNFDRGLEYYQKTLVLTKGKPVSGDIITLYNNIGSLYCRKGEFEKAIPYFEKSLELSSIAKFKQMRGYPLLNLGKVYARLGEEKKGLEYMQQALAVTVSEKTPDQEALTLVNLAEVTADTQEANRYLVRALFIAENLGEKQLQVEALDAMTSFYKKTKRFEQALASAEKRDILHDSIFSLEKAKEIANLQAVYELEKSNSKIDELEAANRKNTIFRNTIITIAVILALLLCLMSVFLWRIRNLNRKLQQSEQALKKANEDKDKLFSVIGHDLRNHVANVPVVLEMLEEEEFTEDERKFLLDSLKDNAYAAKDTLEKLLSWGKSQLKGIVAIPSTFNARLQITNKLRLMKTASEQKQIKLVNNIAEDIQVFADEEHFKFVMRNLLSNAIKYTHHHGLILIDAARHNGFVTFSVQDNGIGMDEGQKQHVFDSFNISNEGTDQEKGNGIGLMLCKEFIAKNNGKIWVESDKGKGSTFYFSLKEANA
ncbi:MAG TPA: tetratricopeptide repeat protein [Flavipsychrobacter sp.]|nr:tetratricopeptide repeat protein [Flavipsychrobacter sp.]